MNKENFESKQEELACIEAKKEIIYTIVSGIICCCVIVCVTLVLLFKT